LCLFWEVTKVLYSHQAQSQRGSRGRQQVIVEVRKVELSSGDEYIAKTRQEGRQKSETSAFTSQSEISRIGTLSFLWCSFRIAFISSSFCSVTVELAKAESNATCAVGHCDSCLRSHGTRHSGQHRKSPKPQTLFRKSKFPYISYTFTGKLDLTDIYLPDVRPRRRIPRRRASHGVYLMRVSHRRVPHGACISYACILRMCMSWGYTS
jgi:hypothetical protein